MDMWGNLPLRKVFSIVKEQVAFVRMLYHTKVAFITFNYDRSLEYFLFDSFYHSFQQSCQRQHAGDCVPFTIIHVYGAVAPLSLMDWYNNAQYYGDDCFKYFKQVKDYCENIHVIGEERANGDIKKQVKELLQEYKRIFVLGFSFDQDNLDVIDLPNNINENWKIWGTAKGMTEREIAEARSRINSRFPDYARNDPGYSNPIIKNVDSCSLLREYL